MQALSEWLRELEATVGGTVVQEPGMEYGAAGAWWGDKKLRPQCHEGVDIVQFQTRAGATVPLGNTSVRAIERGRVVARFPDFIGETLVVQRGTAQSEFWLYAHMTLAEQAAVGTSVECGDVVGCAAVSSKKCPSHLHLSLMRATTDEASSLAHILADVSWMSIHSTTTLSFVPIMLPVLIKEPGDWLCRGPKDVQVRTDGRLSEHLLALHRRVFGNDIDVEAWVQRMAPGRSWSITTSHGFIAVHLRGEEVANVWRSGVVKEERGAGHFHALVSHLLSEVGLWRRLTMTTRPAKFGKMFRILSSLRFGQRCDEPGDAASGKSRFSVPGWVVFARLRWRTLATIGLAAGIASCGAATFAVRLARRGLKPE